MTDSGCKDQSDTGEQFRRIFQRRFTASKSASHKEIVLNISAKRFPMIKICFIKYVNELANNKEVRGLLPKLF